MTAKKGESGVRESVLNFMRDTQRSAAGTRAERQSRQASAPQKARGVAFSDLPEYKRVVAQRAAGVQIGLDNPFYRAHEATAGATTIIDGIERINFASYDYLGMNQHPEVMAKAKQAIDRYGISASASRLVAGERPPHAELETRIANLYGVDASVLFVSGYLTNVTTIGSLLGPKDLVIHDEFIHNSALVGAQLSGAMRRNFKHNDLRDLERVLRTVEGQYRRVLVIVEGIYSMDGDVADLPTLIRLRHDYGFWLMVDEAHALGVLGKTGRGTFEHHGVDPTDVDIWMGTLSKTTASCGGYIAGSRELVELLKAHSAGFIYSVGLAPAFAAAASASLDILAREPERTEALRANGRLFLKLATEAGLDIGQSEGFSVVPVIVGDSLRAVQLSNDLLAAGVNALPIIHPAVSEGLARLRFFITSQHTPEQIRRTVEITAAKLKSLVDRNFGIGSVDIQDVLRTMNGLENDF